MAKRTVTQLTDDLDGRPIEDGGGSTITFGVDGTSYEIDLSKAHADELGAALAPYIGAARRVGGRSGGTRSRSTSKSSSGVDPKSVRAWAEANGVKVSERGRIPANVVAQFQEAGN